MMEQTTLNALLAQVIDEARRAGIPVSREIDPVVRVNRRARTRFGCCIQKNGRYYIEIAGQMTRADEKAVRQVLAHEVLHSCRGCANHGQRWKAYAAKMGQLYGYDITRTDSFEKLGLEDQRPVRYLITCQDCGRQMKRMKRSALVEHPERYRCRCGGALKVEEVEETEEAQG
jgi:predicted SprT family Zn-dependent metalloprotease